MKKPTSARVTFTAQGVRQLTAPARFEYIGLDPAKGGRRTSIVALLIRAGVPPFGDIDLGETLYLHRDEEDGMWAPGWFIDTIHALCDGRWDDTAERCVRALLPHARELAAAHALGGANAASALAFLLLPR